MEKLVYAKFSDWVDEMEMHFVKNEERTELVVRLGKERAKQMLDGAKDRGSQLPTECSLCMTPICIEEANDANFKFLHGVEGEVILGWFDLAKFLEGRFDEEQPCMTPCNHLFGHRCLQQWLNTKETDPYSEHNDCPLCRMSFGSLGRSKLCMNMGKRDRCGSRCFWEPRKKEKTK